MDFNRNKCLFIKKRDSFDIIILDGTISKISLMP